MCWPPKTWWLPFRLLLLNDEYKYLGQTSCRFWLFFSVFTWISFFLPLALLALLQSCYSHFVIFGHHIYFTVRKIGVQCLKSPHSWLVKMGLLANVGNREGTKVSYFFARKGRILKKKFRHLMTAPFKLCHIPGNSTNAGDNGWDFNGTKKILQPSLVHIGHIYR